MLCCHLHFHINVYINVCIHVFQVLTISGQDPAVSFVIKWEVVRCASIYPKLKVFSTAQWAYLGSGVSATVAGNIEPVKYLCLRLVQGMHVHSYKKSESVWIVMSLVGEAGVPATLQQTCVPEHAHRSIKRSQTQTPVFCLRRKHAKIVRCQRGLHGHMKLWRSLELQQHGHQSHALVVPSSVFDKSPRFSFALPCLLEKDI